MNKISITINNKTASYCSKRQNVSYVNRFNVVFECTIPANWGLTRIAQFMESLINADII